MPNKSPSQEQRVLERTERERELEREEFIVTVGDYKELGEAIAEYGRRVTFDIPFAGTAELVKEDGLTILRIELVANTTELYRCSVCGLVPERPASDNPGLCINCMKKVCEKCSRRHRNQHHAAARTIGGDTICTPRVRCGHEGCPTCHGVPF